MFYLQTITYELDEGYSLGSDDIANILVRYYDFELIGTFKEEELTHSMRSLNTAWMGYVTEPHYTKIDIYDNWERYAVIYDVINSCTIFYREGLNEHIKKIIDLYK